MTDVETGKDIPAVVSVEVPRFGADDPIRVNLEIFAEMELVGEPRFIVADPKTGTKREVKSITFADGETIEF
ncbi:hypothetical protein [Mesorhizobium silamurunense]|uniref:hypothetical protein n=1 Tax=Mesorhizobium silamurunense TaxID=499528 RepID=UPI0017816885|nr:hypothetical protein [Mesorhizobium silamurunense]